MTDPTNQVSLEEVRTRFLDAEARLSEAATAVGAIEAAAERLGAAREGLGVAGASLGELATSMGEVASSLTDNATHLREGVEAIRAGDPAEIKRQIQELDSAFTAMQAVVGDRLSKLEQHAVSIATDLTALSSALDGHVAASRRESRIAAVVLGILVVGSIVVALLT